MYSLPMRVTLAALTIASAASTAPTKPLVSTIPSASRGILFCPRFSVCMNFTPGCNATVAPRAAKFKTRANFVCPRSLTPLRDAHYIVPVGPADTVYCGGPRLPPPSKGRRPGLSRGRAQAVTSKTSEQAPEGRAGGGAEGSLGEQLRRARTERGVNLREVAEQTRITMRHLEAIEAGDYKELPGGIFNKSFIKSYARYVGFPEARALELYEREVRERGLHTDEAATTPQRSRVYTGESARSPLVTYGLSAVIVLVLISVVYLSLNWWNNKKAQTAGPAATPTPAAASTPAATPTPPPAVEGFKVQLKATQDFWLQSWQEGDKKKRSRFLKADAPEEYEPTAPFNLHYDLVSAGKLQVTVNGRALKTPTDTTTWTLTKDKDRKS